MAWVGAAGHGTTSCPRRGRVAIAQRADAWHPFVQHLPLPYYLSSAAEPGKLRVTSAAIVHRDARFCDPRPCRARGRGPSERCRGRVTRRYGGLANGTETVESSPEYRRVALGEPLVKQAASVTCPVAFEQPRGEAHGGCPLEIAPPT